MSYIDAGYAAALGTLAVYATFLWYRRRRLERIVHSLGEIESRHRPEARS